MRAVVFGCALLALSGASMGCSCGDGSLPPGSDGGPGTDSRVVGPHCGDECVPATPPGTMGQACCEMTNQCVDYNLNMLCNPGFTCPVANVMIDASCEVTCSSCVERPALQRGFLATDLDFVIDATHAGYLSGYSPGNPPGVEYGDLVWTGVDLTDAAVDWEIVDGAPSMPVSGAPSGWRHGVAAPGDDVGRWSSMAVSATGTFYVAYYDTTHGSLRLAIGEAGNWDVQTVDDTGDAGRYASMLLTSTGAPMIAYLGFETNATGEVHSHARVALASSATPAAAADWTITRIADGVSPCRQAFCNTGETCLATGACVAESGTCSPACTGDDVCVGGTCQASVPSDFTEDLLPGRALYTQLVAAGTGYALVYYDRTAGNLYGVASDGTTWGTPFLIDGYGRNDPSVGDSGIGASIAIDSNGLWHVTYVDGAEEVLRYARLNPGTPPTVTVREVIDDGSTVDGTMQQPDGRHIVGDDSSVVAVPGGEIRVAYQDATSLRTMIAYRSPTGTWSHQVLDPMQHNGYWVEQVLDGSETYVASWYLERSGTMLMNGIHVTHVPPAP